MNEGFVDGCYDAVCSDDKKKIVLTVDGANLECEEKGQKIETKGVVKGFAGEVLCPDPAHFCKDVYINCPDFCNGNGYCGGDGRCVC